MGDKALTIIADFIPWKEDVPQLAIKREFQFIKYKDEPEIPPERVMNKLWDYAKRNGLAVQRVRKIYEEIPKPRFTCNFCKESKLLSKKTQIRYKKYWYMGCSECFRFSIDNPRKFNRMKFDL